MSEVQHFIFNLNEFLNTIFFMIFLLLKILKIH